MENNVQITSDRKSMATTSLTCAIVGLVGMFANISFGSSAVHFAASLAIISIPVLIIGLVLGIFGIKSSRKTFALAGIILCAVGLVLTIALNSFTVKQTETTTTSNTQ